MAYEMEFISDDGVEHTESYWIIVQSNINKIDKNANFTFYGYHNKAARDAKKQNIGSKNYSLSSDEFDTYLGTSALNPEGKNPYEAAYAYANATLEGQAPAEGEEDTRVSFFDGATEV
jgi:hypothetical protein